MSAVPSNASAAGSGTEYKSKMPEICPFPFPPVVARVVVALSEDAKRLASAFKLLGAEVVKLRFVAVSVAPAVPPFCPLPPRRSAASVMLQPGQLTVKLIVAVSLPPATETHPCVNSKPDSAPKEKGWTVTCAIVGAVAGPFALEL